MWETIAKSGWARTTLSCFWKSEQPMPSAFLCLLNNIKFHLHFCWLVGLEHELPTGHLGCLISTSLLYDLVELYMKSISRLMQYNAVSFFYIRTRRLRNKISLTRNISNHSYICVDSRAEKIVYIPVQ